MLVEEKDEDSRQGIQSIEVGVPLLRVLAAHNPLVALNGDRLETLREVVRSLY